jgi:hypothetical protein
MTDKNNAPQEIDVAALDQVVGAGGYMVEARNQEQADKLRGEQTAKRQDNFTGGGIYVPFAR